METHYEVPCRHLNALADSRYSLNVRSRYSSRLLYKMRTNGQRLPRQSFWFVVLVRRHRRHYGHHRLTNFRLENTSSRKLPLRLAALANSGQRKFKTSYCSVKQQGEQRRVTALQGSLWQRADRSGFYCELCIKPKINRLPLPESLIFSQRHGDTKREPQS